MADADEPKPEQAAEETPDVYEESEEGGWPSWLSWGLVIVAAVFGGFLLGSQGKGPAGGQSNLDKIAISQQIALLKMQHKQALQRADQVLQSYMMAFSREMIRVGLFRDGLDDELKGVKGDLDKTIEQLGKTAAKPEERLTKATGELKQIDKKLGTIAQRYSKHSQASEKVGKLGTADQAIKKMDTHLAYFYLVRINELLPEAQAGDKSALREARGCRARLGPLDPKLAQEMDTKFPLLTPQRPDTAATTAPATAPSTKTAP